MEKPYHRSIVDALKSVKRPGYYAAGGEVAMPLPAISFNGDPDTVLGLPICVGQAKHLIELASRAPFGRGEQTIIDTSVRCTWQLNPTQFSITNPRWEESLQQLLDKVKTELGCDTKMKVMCELYKLLLYEQGGFFKKHRDTEKAEGMFGTLVIQLPSNYTGGKLIVYHQGKKSEFDYSGPDCRGNCYFTSFYADCQHEVKKVTKGYRLCLVYNLMYQGIDECPAPADNQKQISAIVSAIKQWQEDDTESGDCPGTVTYLLEHKYCEASLSFRLLKNCDRAVADVLAQAKAEVDFDLYVGQVKFTEHWSVDNFDRGYIPLQCEDASVCVKHLKAFGGEYTLPHIDIYKESFVQEDFFDTINPDEEEYEEATGNEGATLDKQYNWAALLLWPTGKRMTVIGVSNMIELFKQDVDARKKDLDSTARYLMKEMRSNNPEFQSYLTFLLALQETADTQLIAEMLDVIAGMEASYRFNSFIEDTTFCSLLISISCRYGWDILKSPLQTMFGKCSSNNVEKFCAFLKRLIISGKLDEEKDLCKDLLCIIVKVLTEEKDATLDRNSSFRGFEHHRSKEFVSQLFSLLTAVGSDDLFASVNSALRNKPARYSILEILGPAIIDFCKSTKVEGPLQVILVYCVSQLEVSLQRVVPAPTNNTKPVRFTCSCKDCVELKKFLSHPTETEHQFNIGKGRRQHLQQQLYRSGVDATYITEHFGMPHTLVVTKTNQSYHKAVKELEQKQEQERALLASLQPLLAVTDIHSGNEPPIKKQKANSQLVSGSLYIDLT